MDNNSDLIRKRALTLAQLDWVTANLEDKTVQIGEILQSSLCLKKNIFSFSEALELLNGEGKDLMLKYAPLFANNVKKNIVLHLNDLLFVEKSVYLDIVDVNDDEKSILGYAHVIPRESGVSNSAVGTSAEKERDIYKMKSAFLANMSHELRTPIKIGRAHV